jgi:hypothetical protein
MFETRILSAGRKSGRKAGARNASADRRLTCDLPEEIGLLPGEAKLVQQCLADILADLLR